MRIRISLKPVIPLFLLVFLAACGNLKQLEAEKKRLQIENETLKNEVKQLTNENNKFKSELDSVKAELEDLKQTDQYLFSKAKEHFESADLKKGLSANEISSNLKAAKELLDKLLTRFPNSTYKVQTTGLLKEVNNKIAIIDAVEHGESEIKRAISSREFDKAWATLKSIKNYISVDSYNETAKIIDKVKEEPVYATIADIDDSRSNFQSGQKIIVSGYAFWVGRLGHNIDLCEKVCGAGICISVDTLSSGISKDTVRQLKRSDCSDSLYVTIIGEVGGYTFHAENVEIK
ncbi:MAG: hypothetical protein HY096_11100 [Nitrospinae bacterium]|nr:hypothetical protein [Nitrospinota bacterium]